MLGCFLNGCNPIANQPIKKQLKAKIHHTSLHSFIPLILSNSFFTSSSPKLKSHGQKLQTLKGVFSTKTCKGSTCNAPSPVKGGGDVNLSVAAQQTHTNTQNVQYTIQKQ